MGCMGSVAQELRWGGVLDPGAGWILLMTTCATQCSNHWLPPSQEFERFPPIGGNPSLSLAGAPEGPSDHQVEQLLHRPHRRPLGCRELAEPVEELSLQ